MKFKYITYLLIALFTITLFNGCGKSKRKIVFDTKPVSIKNFDTPPGADPSVPADQAAQVLRVKAGKQKPITAFSAVKMLSKAEALLCLCLIFRQH